MAKKETVDAGKNIRVSTEAWLKIRNYCFKNGLKMGAFVEVTSLKQISFNLKERRRF